MSHKGVFLVSVGMRHKAYCANVGRTLIVDPDKVRIQVLCGRIWLLNLRLQEQESIYHLLLNLQTELLSKMKDGAVIRDIYHHALSYIKKQKPELEKHFVKNLGFGVSSHMFTIQRLYLDSSMYRWVSSSVTRPIF